ncbi:ATP-binding protein [Aquipuribacter nitratireducens]|uniref:ATP-binding protein n=1 Tax=Aquipuribacter nitratireducens TaxID=650104 RepID=A0ABW0GPD6_9MICO
MAAADPGDARGPGSRAVADMTSRLVGVLVLLTVPAWGHGALDQRDLLAPWWNVLALATVVAPAAWLAIQSARRRGDVRPPAVVLAAGVALCLLLWPYGVVDVDGAAQGLPWLWLVLPLTLSVLGTLGSVPVSLGYGLAVGVEYALVRVEPYGGSGPLSIVLLEVALITALAAGPALLVVAAGRAATRLDVIAAEAAAASAAAARANAALQTRRELDATLHDTVLAALHSAVRDPAAPELPRLADRALRTFGEAPERTSQGAVDPHALAQHLHDGLAVVAPDADLDVRGGTAVPAEVARALVEAALEAARNARRHGGGAGATPDIAVHVDATTDGSGVAVVVRDDGVGFDPRLVPPHRMGLAVSVHARMERVGGRAEVVTATGSGTTVRLSWRPAAPSPDGGPPAGPLAEDATETDDGVPTTGTTEP